MNNTIKNEIGNRYGNLIITGLSLEKKDGKRVMWTYLCNCGRTGVVRGTSLRAGKTKSCKYCSKVKDEVGNRYGKLVVIKRGESIKNSGATWICRCDCGNEVSVRGVSLRGGRSNSCGCLRPVGESLDNGVASFREVFRKYNASAISRGLLWDLDENLFRKITSENCFYCGAPPTQIGGGKARYHNGHYFYNGIDRINSDFGYTQGNVVPCCWTCNCAKRRLSIKEFHEWATNLSNKFVKEYKGE